METRFELFDHTADIGVRVCAASLPELVRAAGEGFYAVIGELLPTGEARLERFELAGTERVVLLRDYLAELLLLFERDHRMLAAVHVEVFDSARLVVTGKSRLVNAAMSAFDREVKAVTYHGLVLREIKGGFEAEYIVDI